MNDYRFHDLSIGREEHFTVSITEDMLSCFLQITGDNNPLHTDRQFAIERGCPDRVVYGMLTASFISTLGGVYLPGRQCLLHEVESKFIRPVFIGDRLTVSGTVTALHESVKQVEIKVVITNQDHEKILRGKLKAGFSNE